MDCVFCKIIAGDIPSDKVYEDDSVYAFRDIAPQAPVHIIVIPKEHIESADDITIDNSDYIKKIFEKIPEIAKKCGLENGYRIINNCLLYTSETIDSLRQISPIKVGLGIELGQATFALDAAQKALSAYDWDFVLGSLHNIEGGTDFYYVDYRSADIEKLTSLYFKDLYDLVKWNGFDVLSHLYYHLRYIYRQGLELDIKKYETEIREIFKLLISNGKGIEVNNSSLYDAFGDVIPGLYFLKIYREMGGEIITIGSDAHVEDRVGLGVDYAVGLLKEAGFKAISSFEKRKVSFIDI